MNSKPSNSWRSRKPEQMQQGCWRHRHCRSYQGCFFPLGLDFRWWWKMGTIDLPSWTTPNVSSPISTECHIKDDLMIFEMFVDVASTLEICHWSTPVRWFGVSAQGICGNWVAGEKPYFDPSWVPLGGVHTTPDVVKPSTIWSCSCILNSELVRSYEWRPEFFNDILRYHILGCSVGPQRWQNSFWWQKHQFVQYHWWCSRRWCGAQYHSWYSNEHLEVEFLLGICYL